jgi:hypothetical protein
MADADDNVLFFGWMTLAGVVLKKDTTLEYNIPIPPNFDWQSEAI